MTAVPYPPVTGTEPCTRVNPDRFFPDTGNTGGAAYAARQCDGCPILQPCLKWALANERFGVWAGTTAEERAKIRRRGNKAAA